MCCAIVVDIMGSHTAAKTLPATRRQLERPFALTSREAEQETIGRCHGASYLLLESCSGPTTMAYLKLQVLAAVSGFR